LDDREVDLDLVEPTGVDGGVHRHVRIPAMVTIWFGLMATSNRSVATPVSFL
jgi:hypothetical protein